MILFASAGSWGEIQPLLAMAEHFNGEFACDDRWVAYAEQYGTPVHSLGQQGTHDFTIGGFWESLDMDLMTERLYAASKGATAIVSAFFLSPAKIVAELRGIPWIATTTSPIYFRETGAMSPERIQAMSDKLNAIRLRKGLQPQEMPYEPKLAIGLFPDFLGEIPFPVVGYPRLAPLVPMPPFPFREYCLVSTGSINPHDWMEEAVSACNERGIGCIYLGGDFERPDSVGIPFDLRLDTFALMKGAKEAVIHGGIGTMCEAIEAGTPISVRPFAFDQFYNAGKLVELGAAIWPNPPSKVSAKVASTQHILQDVETLFREWL